MTLTEHFEIQLALEMGITPEQLRERIRIGGEFLDARLVESSPVRTYAFLCLASERGISHDALDDLLDHKCSPEEETFTAPTSQDLINSAILHRLEILEESVADRAAYPLGRPIA